MRKKNDILMPNLKYMYSNWRNYDKNSIVLFFLRIPPMVAEPIVNALIIKVIMDGITSQIAVPRMLALIGGMCALLASIAWINPYLNDKMTAVAVNMSTFYRINAFKKMMSTDYKSIESFEGRHRFEESKIFISNNQYSVVAIFRCTLGMLAAGLGMFSYIFIFSVLNPIIVLILIVLGIFKFFVVRFEMRKLVDEEGVWIKEFMKTEYVFRTANDFSTGKDIRIFGFEGLFARICARISTSIRASVRRYRRNNAISTFLGGILAFCAEITAFVYLINEMVNNNMSASDFLFYFTLMTGFFAWIGQIINSYHNIEHVCKNCQKYRNFLEAEDKFANGTLTAPLGAPPSIEFRNVSFSYADGGEKVLSDLSFSVKSGEKIAIVGENGSGKTTCIKLLCGFYRPDSGQILVDGQDILQYDHQSYVKLFSAVFQDFVVLPMSIANNIALKENAADIDRDRVQKILQEVELFDKFASLDKGIDTLLIKKVHKSAIDLSGGETQRLLLARALYKNAPVLILDEPTAALDPIAENDIYMRYNELTKNRTSFFISHRLSSTRFCDKILYISGGVVREEGTHEELMAKKGDYWRMYEVQSNYYKITKSEGEL